MKNATSKKVRITTVAQLKAYMNGKEIPPAPKRDQVNLGWPLSEKSSRFSGK